MARSKKMGPVPPSVPVLSRGPVVQGPAHNIGDGRGIVGESYRQQDMNYDKPPSPGPPEHTWHRGSYCPTTGRPIGVKGDRA